MLESKGRFGWAAIRAAFLCGQVLLLSSAGSALAQSAFEDEVAGGLCLPRSWVTRWYARGEYLALWVNDDPLPALVTTSPAGTPRADAGVLGEPETEVLVGEENWNDRPQPGGRLTFGYWLDDAHTFAWEAQMWMTSIGSAGADASSTGDPIFARPFFNTENGLEDAQLVAYPSVVPGALRTDGRREASSVNVLGRCNWLQWDGGHLDFSCGYRFFRFRESLTIRELLTSTILVSDDFGTVNDFHGVDLGAVFGLRRGEWLFDVTTKVALGDMRQKLSIDGSTKVDGNPSLTVPGGWLAAPSNLGVYTNHEFVAIPELGLRSAFVPDPALDSFWRGNLPE